MRNPFAAPAFALALVLSAATTETASSAVEAQEQTVRIDNFTFAPARLTVKAGSTVRWVNEDDIPHAVAASGRSFKSPVLDTEQSFTFRFDKPGVYEYFCSLHPHMKGAIVVE